MAISKDPNPAWYANTANTNSYATMNPLANTNWINTPQIHWNTQTFTNVPNQVFEMGPSLEHLLLAYIQAGETPQNALQRILEEFAEMKAMLHDLAVLADNHGEDTICL